MPLVGASRWTVSEWKARVKRKGSRRWTSRNGRYPQSKSATARPSVVSSTSLGGRRALIWEQHSNAAALVAGARGRREAHTHCRQRRWTCSPNEASNAAMHECRNNAFVVMQNVITTKIIILFVVVGGGGDKKSSVRLLRPPRRAADRSFARVVAPTTVAPRARCVRVG